MRQAGLKKKSAFVWPGQAKAALSLSWDDGRKSQLNKGLPMLDRFGLKATFYLHPQGPTTRASWKGALAQGHEVGNHTCSHPCSGNFEFSRANAIEDYSLARMEKEILDCNQKLRRQLGVTPRTFAYPCGQNYVGRGRTHRSTVPLVAKNFLAGRAYLSEHSNDPRYCDLSLLSAAGIDERSVVSLKAEVERAIQQGTWLIFAGHEIGRHPQGMDLKVLERFCRYLVGAQARVWVAPVWHVAAWVSSARQFR